MLVHCQTKLKNTLIMVEIKYVLTLGIINDGFLRRSRFHNADLWSCKFLVIVIILMTDWSSHHLDISVNTTPNIPKYLHQIPTRFSQITIRLGIYKLKRVSNMMISINDFSKKKFVVSFFFNFQKWIMNNFQWKYRT